MKRMTAICLLSTLLTSQACSAEIANTQVPAPSGTEVNRNEQRRDNNETTVRADTTSIKDTKGLIILSKKYGKGDFVRLYNEDGSPWYEFSFYYEQIGDGKFPENENFAPFAFHPDYFVLALKCVGEDESRYEVIVNEKTGLRKFVKKSDPALKFETWEDHILKAFAVEFDSRENALRDSPGGNVKNPNLPQDATFRPVQISGEWLKVRWDRSEQPKKDVEFGWVRWRDNSQILVELFYFS